MISVCSQMWNFLYLPMRIFARKTLRDFWIRHSDSEVALRSWFSEAKNSRWESPADIKKIYPHASILPENRVVFNIKGNTYRLVVKINYYYEQVLIRFFGPLTEYENIYS